MGSLSDHSTLAIPVFAGKGQLQLDHYRGVYGEAAREFRHRAEPARLHIGLPGDAGAGGHPPVLPHAGAVTLDRPDVCARWCPPR